MTKSLKDKMLNKKYKKLEKSKDKISKLEANSHFVYILRCSDGTLYTGKAIDLGARLEVHNSGKGAKYTRSKLPVELVYSEEFKSNREAAQRECEIKKFTKAQKEQLILGKTNRSDSEIGSI